VRIDALQQLVKQLPLLFWLQWNSARADAAIRENQKWHDALLDIYHFRKIPVKNG